MIEISVWKIFLVLVVALIVLGPDHLPKAARTLGRLLTQFKGALGTVQKQFSELSTEVQKEQPSDEEKQEEIKKQ